MIDFKKLKENKKYYLKKFEEKNYFLEKEVDEAIKFHNEYLLLLKNNEILRSELNVITKEISNLKNVEEIKKKKKIAKDLSEKITLETEKQKQSFFDFNKLLLIFPNIFNDENTIGKNEKSNVEIFKKNTNLINKNKKNHLNILEEKKLIMLEENQYISGTRNVIFVGKIVKLINALKEFMIETHEQNYLLVEPPVMVNEQCLENTGQLPKFKDDLYQINNNQYLIPTAEVPLTNLVQGKTILEKELPLNYFAYTMCFRSEAGAAGKDTKGIIRLHQFRKVELVKIGKPDDFNRDFDEILKQACKVLDLLELPYRVIELCSGDLSFGSFKTYDLEVWLPSLQDYKEISSVSCMSDFQARRMKTRVRYNDETTNFVFTYNASALAMERTLVAIIENYYDESKKVIKVPQILQKFLNFKEI